MLEISVESALNDIGAMLERMANPLPVLSRIGASEVENVRARIETSKLTPAGENWAPWAPRTARARQRKGNAAQGLLWDRGDLLKSIAYDVHYGTLQIGSPLDFAPFLQDGTEHMPAREFLGWNAATYPFYELMLADWIEHGDERASL